MKDSNVTLRNRINSRLERSCACGHYESLHDAVRCNAWNCPCQTFRSSETDLLWDEWDERSYNAFEEWLREREMRENELELRGAR